MPSAPSRSRAVLKGVVATAVLAGGAFAIMPRSSSRRMANLAHTAATAFVADSFVADLSTGRQTLSSATTAAFIDSLRGAPGGLRGLAAFHRSVAPNERTALNAVGITVLSSVARHLYRVHVTPAFAPADSLVTRLLIGVAMLRPQDRVAPAIWASTDSVLQVRVAVRFGTDSSAIARHLSVHAPSAIRVTPDVWEADVPRSALRALAASDLVHWIDRRGRPIRIDNENTRPAVGVDAVQDFNTVLGTMAGLGGAGVQVGVSDVGMDQAHDDFRTLSLGSLGASRVISSVAKTNWHGTMVAGILAGNGYRSNKEDTEGVANGDVPYLWRGMAPQAELIEIVITNLPERWQVAAKMSDAIATFGMDVSNHSHSLEEALRSYGAFTAQSDSMIRGDALSGATAIPRRLQLFSAGNLGGHGLPNATADNHGYFSVDNQVKNGVVVGSWIAPGAPSLVPQNRIASSSSLGPTMDGRIRPDVVAPGAFVKSTGSWKPGVDYASQYIACPIVLPAGTESMTTVRGQFYSRGCGTSFAVAVATGTVALMLEQFHLATGMDIDEAPPLPSTLRGVLIHSANDKAGTYWHETVDGPVRTYAGPDFVTGFGLLNAAGAVDLIKEQRFVEGELDATCDSRSFAFSTDLPTGRRGGAVAGAKITLAWDDAASDIFGSTDNARLVNDLDLVLIDPLGNTHYPWKRNQRILNDAGSEVAAVDQVCGTSITAERMLTPPGPVTSTQLAEASTGRGPDHLNNVEQVVTFGPPGIWTAVVSGFDIRFGPQKFSVIGLQHRRVLQFFPTVFCLRYTVCRNYFIPLCNRYPNLCQRPQIIPIFPGGPRFSFAGASDRAVLPVSQLCAQLDVPGGCGVRGVDTARVEFRFGATRVPGLRIDLVTANGAVVASGTTSRTPVTLTARLPGRIPLLAVVAPPDSVDGGAIDLPVTIRRLSR